MTVKRRLMLEEVRAMYMFQPKKFSMRIEEIEAAVVAGKRLEILETTFEDDEDWSEVSLDGIQIAFVDGY